MFGGVVCVHFEARRAGRQPQPEHQNKRSRFWQNCWRWRFQSFNHKTTSWWLLLCCLSACGATLAEIFIFFLESAPYVYVQRVSDLRSLLNGWRVPELRRCKTAFKAMSVSPVLPSSGVKPAPKGQALRIAVRVGFGWNNC